MVGLWNDKCSEWALGDSAILQRFHVGEPIRLFGVVFTDQFRSVVEYDDAVKFDIGERLHDVVHVVIAVIHKSFDEVRKRRADIPEVNLPNLFGAEIANHFFGTFVGELGTAFQPRAATEANSDVWAIGDLQGSFITFEVGEDAAWNASQYGLRGIIRMDADAHIRLFGYWNNLFDEVGVVVPNFLLRELSPVR